MPRARFHVLVVALAAFAAVPASLAQRRPYIGYVYPAGAQQATTVALKLGGQELDDVTGLLVTGTGVTARVVDYQRKLNPQEIQLLREQLSALRRARPTTTDDPAKAASTTDTPPDSALLAKVERRTREWVQTPACAAIANLLFAEVTISPDAEPGPRELRVATARGISNPLVFHIGQLFEYARKPMATTPLHVLGKEALALRNRPATEVEQRIALPCVVNGQIAAREANRYRFAATRGQQLVVVTQARQLIPFVADAVPGWFQPVLTLFDAAGRELACVDDYRFSPDPVLRYRIPRDGDYVVEIRDSLYRGREDFLYRIALGELPFITGLFPLGGPADGWSAPEASGWNLDAASIGVRAGPLPDLREVFAERLGLASNPLSFVLSELPEQLEAEGNDTAATAQPVTLPTIVNGRIGRAGDVDVFRFTGPAGATVVIEVVARRLASPLDATIALADAAGSVLAFDDDCEDLVAGLATHQADPRLTVTLPADGEYFVRLTDTARQGGPDYAYRLRLSAPQPDFELRVVPSSLALATSASGALTIYAARRDGFDGSIRVALKDPPSGLTAAPLTLGVGQSVGRLTLKAGSKPTAAPTRLTVVGTARSGEREIVHAAVAAEDRMQAFLWRQLVPARELPVSIYDPRRPPPPRRPLPQPHPPAAAAASSDSSPSPSAAPVASATKPKFSKQQVAGRLRQLKLLYEEGLLSDAFYLEKVAECDAAPP